MHPPPVFFVSGAFGTGKTTLAPMVARWLPECFVMDADWILEPLSALAGQDLSEGSSSTLPNVWLAIARVAAIGGRPSVIFSPCEPDEIETLPLRPSLGESHWLLLDCSEDAIRQRLGQRKTWKATWTEESIVDAARMRTLGLTTLHTDAELPDSTAERIVAWVRDRLQPSS